MSRQFLPTQPGTVAIVGALVAIVAIVTAAIMFTTGDGSLERLAILVAIVGTIVPSLTAALDSSRAAKASHIAAEQTNGILDGRIEKAVQLALQSRRSSDPLPASADELKARLTADPLRPGDTD